jgi:predicted nucleic acid-binding protein
MPAWMLDTVAVIDYYHGRPGVTLYLEAIVRGQASGAFSAITKLELWQSIRPHEEERHEALLALLLRVPLDQAIARRAGKLRQQVGSGRLSLPDAVIAASSELSGCTLLTRNTHDFEPFDKLFAVEFYSRE